MRDPILLHRPQNHLEIELRHGNDGAAALQLREHDHRQAKHVEHRKNAEEDVVDLPGHFLIGGDHLRRGDEVPVREDHALARAGRAGGVEQRGGVVLLDPVRIAVQIDRAFIVDDLREPKDFRDSPNWGNGFPPIAEKDDRQVEILDLGQQFLDGDDNLRRGILELLGKLPDGVLRVDGGGDGADGEDPEEANRVLDRVRGVNENNIVLPHAELEQAMSESRDHRFEVGESEGFSGVGVD